MLTAEEIDKVKRFYYSVMDAASSGLELVAETEITVAAPATGKTTLTFADDPTPETEAINIAAGPGKGFRELERDGSEYKIDGEFIVRPDVSCGFYATRIEDLDVLIAAADARWEEITGHPLGITEQLDVNVRGTGLRTVKLNQLRAPHVATEYENGGSPELAHQDLETGILRYDEIIDKSYYLIISIIVGIVPVPDDVLKTLANMIFYEYETSGIGEDGIKSLSFDALSVGFADGGSQAAMLANAGGLIMNVVGRYYSSI